MKELKCGGIEWFWSCLLGVSIVKEFLIFFNTVWILFEYCLNTVKNIMFNFQCFCCSNLCVCFALVTTPY